MNHGLNVDAGIFLSYIGLFSYYNFDNWTYQPSFVSSNTPWFFNGMRVQWFPTQKLKIEPWLINGWQSYANSTAIRASADRSCGSRTTVRLVFNSYSVGQDNLASGSGYPANGGNPNAADGCCPIPTARTSITPTSRACTRTTASSGNTTTRRTAPARARHFEDGDSFTWDVGCEYGGGVHCSHGPNKENFFGAMLYDRIWFDHDLFAVTLGGGFMNNPGRYLALVPPINGATAVTGTPYFTENPGQKLYQWDTQLNFQYMPKAWLTWWTEATFRHSSVPYWSGAGGVTPPRQQRRPGEPGVQQRQRRGCRRVRERGWGLVPGSAHARGRVGRRGHGQVLKCGAAARAACALNAPQGPRGAQRRRKSHFGP